MSWLTRLRKLYFDRKSKGLCTKCGSNVQGKTLCKDCAAIQGSRRRIARATRRTVGLCSHCGKYPPKSARAWCEKCLSISRRNNATPAARACSKRTFERIKLAAFSAYGNACACCGESESLFLEIDHVHNDGHRHRVRGRRAKGYDLYLWLKRENYPPGFQVLCSNCNQGKRRNGGTCPHKDKIRLVVNGR